MCYLPISKKTPSSADALPRRVRTALATLCLLIAAIPAAAQVQAPDLKTNIAALSSLDYSARMNAARLIRRAAAAEAVPALVQAVTRHSDEFVRYRAFIVLSSFNDSRTGDLVKTLLRDRNDRLREVAYKWLEAHPDPAMASPLIAALQTEQAEFVRPALVSALAALGEDPQVQRALLPEISRGLDLFRGAVIEALGRRRSAYAVDAIAAVARLQGPLQDDAVVALGRIGGPRATAALAALAKEATAPDLSLTIRAAECVTGQQCDSAIKGLVDAVTAARAASGVIRAGVTGLATIAAA
jgi:HEAT repeat protein